MCTSMSCLESTHENPSQEVFVGCTMQASFSFYKCELQHLPKNDALAEFAKIPLKRNCSVL